MTVMRRWEVKTSGGFELSKWWYDQSTLELKVEREWCFQGFISCLSAETLASWNYFPPDSLSDDVNPPPTARVVYHPSPSPSATTLPTVALIDTYTIQLVQRQGSHRSHRKVIDWNTHVFRHLDYTSTLTLWHYVFIYYSYFDILICTFFSRV